MQIQILLIAGVLALVTALGGVVLLWDERRTPLPSGRAAGANRHAAIAAATAWACLLGALAAGALVASTTNARLGGRAMALLPMAATAVLLAVHAVGELTWPRPRGAVREARLTARRPTDIAPRWLRWNLWASVSGFVVALAVFGSVADGPRTYVGSSGFSASPFPGWWYGVPLTAAALALLAATEAVVRLIALRPAVEAVPAEWDIALRRRSAGRVLRGAQLPLAITAAAVVWYAGLAFARDTGETDLASLVCVALAWLWGVGGVVVAVLPGRAFRASRTPTPVLSAGAPT